MMRPDIKIAIAYNTSNPLPSLLKTTLDRLNKCGYPIKAYLIDSNLEYQKKDLQQLIYETFTNCDILIGIAESKGILLIPRDGKSVKIKDNLTDTVKKWLKNKSCSFHEIFSLNFAYELGMFLAAHTDNKENIFLYSMGQIEYNVIGDAPNLLYHSLDKEQDDRQKVRHIINDIHVHAVCKFFPNFKNFDINNPESKIKSILTVDKYRPVLRNILSTSNNLSVNALYTNLSPLGQYFVNEFNSFESNIEQTLGRRIQYIVDRAVILVYLRDIPTWRNFIIKLNDEIQDLDSENKDIYKHGIQLLKSVFEYHGYMGNGNGNINDIITSLELIEKSSYLKNPMCQCLLYDYLGLCFHKKFFLKCKLLTDSFEIYNKCTYEYFHSLNENDRYELQNMLTKAIAAFDKVNDISFCNDMNSSYIWEGFVLYNKARCKYILSQIFNNSEHDNWVNVMEKSIEIRRNYCEIYKEMPKVICHNLKAEYFHACIELALYRNEGLSHEVVSDFNKWIAENIYYNDVLNVKKKFDMVNKF